MKISAKARYGLAAMVSIGRNYHIQEYTNLVSISEKLGISKIYLEQVFSLLKQAELVISTKGSQGGYQLSRKPEEITAFDILFAIEFSLFQKTEPTVLEKAKDIETAMEMTVFNFLDSTVKETLNNITLQTIMNEAEKHKSEGSYMFFI